MNNWYIKTNMTNTEEEEEEKSLTGGVQNFQQYLPSKQHLH